MSKDISNILAGWDFDSEELTARIILGDDGREKIQLRLDMGLLQMEVCGRPDGQRPEGFESWLEFYEQRERQHEQECPDASPFQLETEDCARLWREGVQYYHRYLSCWHLERYDWVIRDTLRSLRLIKFIRAHARADRTKVQFDQWRPYVNMMHAQACAVPWVKEGKFDEALRAIEQGIEAIKEFLAEYRESHSADECVELARLERWREEVRAEKHGGAPREDRSNVERLHEQLQEAIASEDFEEAARLRDEIQRLSAQPRN